MVLQIKEVENSFTKRDTLFTPDRTTIVPTRHTENVPNVNTISGKEIFYLDCRVLPDYTFNEVIGKIQELAKKMQNRRCRRSNSWLCYQKIRH